MSFNFMTAVNISSDFEAKKIKIKSFIVSTVSPSIYHEVMGPDAMILSFLNVEFKANFFIVLFHFRQEAL